MKIVYLVRHGQTENNLAKITGSPEDPLSELGRRQAVLVAGRLKDIPCGALISSPYVRAWQTAEAIAKAKGMEIKNADLFREVGVPLSLVGKAYDASEALETRKEWFEAWSKRGTELEGGENFYATQERAAAALAFLERHAADEIIVASHGVFIKAIVQEALLGEMLTPDMSTRLKQLLGMSNTSVTVLKREEAGWCLVRWNDTVHLEPDADSW